ncbi:C2 family cysteine protease [Mycobacterium sp. MUNTM1]
MSQIQAWDTQHLVDAAAYWNKIADHWEDVFLQVRNQSVSLPWRGAGGEALRQRTGADLPIVSRHADQLREAAAIARNGAGDVSAAQQRVLFAVATAENAGFNVAEDLSVTAYVHGGSLADVMTLEVLADQMAADIRVDAATLTSIDQTVAAKLATATAGLGDPAFAPAPQDGPFPQDSDGTQPRRYTDKDLYPHDPTAADVHQDSIGDCYLDSTMGAIANANPQWIKDRIRYDDKTGTFDVTLWDGHEWRHVPVTQGDIDTNIQHHGASWLDNNKPDAPLWPAVLESAYAKLKAPNDNLGDALENVIGKGGYPQDALGALTGNRGTTINPQTVWLTNQHIDQSIATALANHQPVTITTTAQGVPLEQSHVYVVEGITGTGSDARVTLRNPWEHNLGTPENTAEPLVTVRLGDLIGSGLPTGNLPNGPFGHHPMSNVNIGSLG